MKDEKTERLVSVVTTDGGDIYMAKDNRTGKMTKVADCRDVDANEIEWVCSKVPVVGDAESYEAMVSLTSPSIAKAIDDEEGWTDAEKRVLERECRYGLKGYAGICPSVALADYDKESWYEAKALIDKERYASDDDCGMIALWGLEDYDMTQEEVKSLAAWAANRSEDWWNTRVRKGTAMGQPGLDCIIAEWGKDTGHDPESLLRTSMMHPIPHRPMTADDMELARQTRDKALEGLPVQVARTVRREHRLASDWLTNDFSDHIKALNDAWTEHDRRYQQAGMEPEQYLIMEGMVEKVIALPWRDTDRKAECVGKLVSGQGIQWNEHADTTPEEIVRGMGYQDDVYLTAKDIMADSRGYLHADRRPIAQYQPNGYDLAMHQEL